MGMLVLSRERDQVIRIGDDIAITVVDIRGQKIRLGVSAPKGIPVDREEIYIAKKRERASIKPPIPNLTHYTCGCRSPIMSETCPHHTDYGRVL